MTFRDKDKPSYILAKIVMVVSISFAMSGTCLLMLYYRWENRRRERVYAEEVYMENNEFMDLTDRENHEFRVSISSCQTRVFRLILC